MKVYTIEIAEAIENELKTFLKEWGGGFVMRFTRFVDLGGKQTDLYAYAGPTGTPPWLIIRIKSVFKSDQGECIQYFVNLVGPKRGMEEVLVSPEVWKLPAVASKVLNFVRSEMMNKIAAGSGSLESGDASDANALGSGTPALDTGAADDDEDLDDIDTAGILAGGDAPTMDFNPEDVIASANAGGSDDDDEDGGFNPEDVIAAANAGEDSDDEDDDGESGFNPEDVIKD